MWKPPEYPGPCFDLYFDKFDGFIFEAEKPFENVCAQGPPQNSCVSFSTFVRLQATEHGCCRCHKSAIAQEAVPLDGVAA